MARALSDNVTSMSPSPQQIQKQQSKQIKRQTKMMLKVEEARRDVQKAQKKVADAQLNHELASTRLRTYEEQLDQMRGENSGKS